MKILYRSYLLLLCLLLSSPAFAQRYVDIAASNDPTNLPDLLDIIRGDTTATGERNDNNTIYRLENGGTFVFTGIIRNTPEWPLQIQAQDLTNLDTKPVIIGQPNSSGSYPNFARPEGDVTFRNLWIVLGDNGPLNNHKFGSFRLSGPNTRAIFQDCILEKDRGGMVQVRANGVKIYMDNCILRNGGNRRLLQGNGRGIDFREFTVDTLVMRNTVVHNIVDRFLRSQGTSEPHNYVEIDHCTAFNQSGRHGFIQLSRVRTAKITNNLFINPIMAGTTPAFTDEQNQPDSATHKVITLDTLYSDTDLIISNNNIFWTQEIIDFWNGIDSVSAPGVLSDLVKQILGADTTNAYFSEVLTLEDVPQSIFQYVQDLYADPTSTEMFDIIVEDSVVAGTILDSGNLYDFDNFSPCYPATTQSATADTDGGPIGAVTACANLASSIWGPVIGEFAFRVSPNPAHGTARFSFELEQAGPISLHIYDLSGRMVSLVQAGIAAPGPQEREWQVPADLAPGMYLARLQTSQGVQALRLMIQ